MLRIYYGTGKGKTYSAVGEAVCTASKGHSVLYVDFVKTQGDSKFAAFEMFPQISVTSVPMESDVSFELEQARKAQVSKIYRELFDTAVRTVLTRQFDMLVLDKVFDAVSSMFLSDSEIYGFLSNAPDSLEIVCTGQSVDDKFLELAESCTQFCKTDDKDE